MTQIEQTISMLQERKTNLCCDDVKALLSSLGFDVRDGKQGGHKIFVHQGIPSFMSGSFNCGHGKNPEINPAYIGKIIQTLKQYHNELERYFGENIMIDPTNYTISVRKGWFDGELCFEARVFELPDIAEYADSYEEAYQLTLDTLVTTAEIFAEQGRAMPEPVISNDEPSDYITLNLAKNLYRTLTLAAKNEGVNLNQHLVNVLNHYADCVH